MSNSPLETMIEFVKPGMTVVYSDMCNNEDFKVLSVSEKIITLEDENGEVFQHRIGRMQYGWRISCKDLEFIRLTNMAATA